MRFHFAGLIVLWAPLAVAAGALDVTFGEGGKVTTRIRSYSSAAATVVQADGRIVTAGTVGTPGMGIDLYIGITRHLSNGDLDPSFGTGGVLVDLAEPAGAVLEAMVLQPDGRIVVAGWGLGSGFWLIRYRGDGSRDPTFGVNGLVTTDLSPLQAKIHALVLQPDGSIVAAGEALKVVPNADSPRSFLLARYAANGLLDASFGNGGIVQTAFDLKAVAHAVALQPGGEIVAAGYTQASGTAPPSLALARYDAIGALDPTFGVAGKATAHPVASDRSVIALAVAIRPDGRILTAGTAGLIGFTANGIVDPSFGQQGIAVPNWGQIALLSSMVLQPDGKVVAAGFVEQSFGVARFGADGQPDAGFGVLGIARTTFGIAAAASSVALQADGKIIAAGTGEGGAAFALARYLSDAGDPPAVPTLAPATTALLALVVAGSALLVGGGKRAAAGPECR